MEMTVEILNTYSLSFLQLVFIYWKLLICHILYSYKNMDVI
jgi:hypothetical protein